MTEALKSLLVVEDNPGIRKQLKWSFEGYRVLVAEDRPSAMRQFEEHQPPVVTLDLGLPPDRANASEGLAALEQMLNLAPHTKVIVVTGNDERENALKAIALGAYDFYQKPVEPEILGLIVDRACKLYELEAENRRLQAQGERSPLAQIIGASPPMVAACRMVEKIAPTDATTLVLGESGTGKELIARALHQLSQRREGPFVAINCAAIPDNLLESELFGYEKGAFTGAVKQTKGKIEYASGGTFFLDEIGDLSPALQAKILRFLQERVIERIGGRQPIAVDVRIICATHRDLDSLIREEIFREDLYYRISELVIEIPPLREREGDKILLARTFLERQRGNAGQGPRRFSPEALAAIEAYDWPGNVRELENRVRRALVLAEGTHITAGDLGLDEAEATEPGLDLRAAREQAERKTVLRALAIHNHNVSRAAEELGVSRPNLYALMKKLGIQGAGP
jgi:two-component system NtrC family response regulator